MLYLFSCIISTGRCAADCPRTYRPICGSNGSTFRNECFFILAKCHFHFFAKNTMDHAEEEDNKYTVFLEMNVFNFFERKRNSSKNAFSSA